MKRSYALFLPVLLVTFMISCGTKDNGQGAGSGNASSGLKIAYINGDTVLHKFDHFRKMAEVMEDKQRIAEADLQSKGATLEKEIMAYQKQAQSGTLTGKEMEAREKYLGTRQEALMRERDNIAQEIMKESAEINKQLQAALDAKLDELKEKEGYDIIFNSAEGGSVLSINAQFDITDRVISMLNDGSPLPDTTKQQ